MKERLNFNCFVSRVYSIPSKSMLHNSHAYHEAKHDFKKRGIDCDPKLNLPNMLAAKNKSVKQLTGGVEGLFKKNKVDYHRGYGSFISPTEINVKPTDESQSAYSIQAKNVIIATGSEVTPFPGVEIDEKQVVTSTGVLDLEKVPEKMIVIGAGVIGLEMGSVWNRLGSQVEVVEFLNAIGGAGIDGEVATNFQKILKKQGMKFRLGTKVVGMEKRDGKCYLQIEPAAGGERSEMEADVILVCIGRRPVTSGLNLEGVGIETDNKGRVVVDSQFNTSVKGVRCIGDATFGPMLAHKAEEEGVAAVEYIKHGHGHVNYEAIPAVVYTHPEVAWVGQTEESLKEAGIKYSASNILSAGHETSFF